VQVSGAEGKELCFYHEKNRPAPAELYMDGNGIATADYGSGVRGCTFDSNHDPVGSVTDAVTENRAEGRWAGAVWLQIASGNLKMRRRKRPSQRSGRRTGESVRDAAGDDAVVGDREGHDPEEEEEELRKRRGKRKTGFTAASANG